jgi:hypothetical protein
MERTVWSSGGCSSWYLDESGVNTTLWPGTTTEFRSATRRVDLGEYEVVRAAVAKPAEVTKARTKKGRGDKVEAGAA